MTQSIVELDVHSSKTSLKLDYGVLHMGKKRLLYMKALYTVPKPTAFAIKMNVVDNCKLTLKHNGVEVQSVTKEINFNNSGEIEIEKELILDNERTELHLLEASIKIDKADKVEYVKENIIVSK